MQGGERFCGGLHGENARGSPQGVDGGRARLRVDLRRILKSRPGTSDVEDGAGHGVVGNFRVDTPRRGPAIPFPESAPQNNPALCQHHAYSGLRALGAAPDAHLACK